MPPRLGLLHPFNLTRHAVSSWLLLEENVPRLFWESGRGKLHAHSQNLRELPHCEEDLFFGFRVNISQEGTSSNFLEIYFHHPQRNPAATSAHHLS